MNSNYDERELLPRLIPSAGHPRTLCCAIAPEDVEAGSLLSRILAARFGRAPLPPDRMVVHFRGTPGDGFAAGLGPGVTFVADDAAGSVGRDMSGGQVILLSPPAGEVGRGMTGGQIFLRLPSPVPASLRLAPGLSLRRVSPDSPEARALRLRIGEHAALADSGIAAAIAADGLRALASFVCISAARSPRTDAME